MNPRTGPKLAAALTARFPGTIATVDRASFNEGSEVRLAWPDGTFVRLTSRHRREVHGEGVNFYGMAYDHYQGARGFDLLCADIDKARAMKDPE